MKGSRMSAAPRFALLAVIALAACQDGSQPTAPIAPEGPQAVRSPVAQARLEAIFQRTSPEVMALPGTVFADNDEVGGKVVFGVENAAAMRGVRQALARLGVDEADYEIRLTKPIVMMQGSTTLRSRFRPTQGGIQIHFTRYLCTMGFNVDHAGGRSFITNSHCTATQGGTESTVYYQPTSSTDPTVIATEASDPQYLKGGSCPKGKKCRRSDASRALYSSSVASNRGQIAKTTGANNGALTVSGTFAVTSQDNSTTRFNLGTVVNKVGRTTGWTQGQVTASCVNTNVSGSQVHQLCQTFVSAGVGGGDSGSPVFKITSGDNVQLVGILWGGSSDGKSFVFSPLAAVQAELGSVTATK
ncbi:MAG: hypothetical protein K0S86_5841 [Geminicoccaceae bacterium]|nr:hypothetical protein [Geminicoccaceae bacterium]